MAQGCPKASESGLVGHSIVVNVKALIASVGRLAWKAGTQEKVRHEIDPDGTHPRHAAAVGTAVRVKRGES